MIKVAMPFVAAMNFAIAWSNRANGYRWVPGLALGLLLFVFIVIDRIEE